MSIKIIKADSSYADAIAMIGKGSFRKTFGHLFDNQNELREYLFHTYDPSKLAKSIDKENNVYFIALKNNEPVGFAKVKLHSLNEQISSGSQMELQKIYVMYEHHGSGAGSALLDSVINLAQETGKEFIWLDTHITNERAIRVYESKGFRITGKYFFTIGSQTFEYHVLSMPVKSEVAV